jgi:hypothetical protein
MTSPQPILVTIESYSGRFHSLQPASVLSFDAVMELVSRIRDDWSTTIALASDKHQLWVSASEGQYAAFAMIGDEDAFEAYDLVGDRTAAGWTEFVHGGQPAPHPRRHCVSAEQVRSVVESFFSTREIDLAAFDWERQAGLQTA